MICKKMKYRPEIDGLRAVAVLPVILFHAGFSIFSGGFVGVDVFFVISGYLITSIILKDLEAGTFSFWEFYERRARRILPALFFVIICCIPFAWMWMMPAELKTFSNTLVSVILFSSNIRLWHQSGYFDTAAELKPLLHTWSLAVEEQFYIFFPIAMLILWRLGRKNVVAAIAFVAVVSLALSEYGSRYHPSFNFYWLPTRAWELAAGSLCSFVAIKPKAVRDDLLSVAGLAAILFAVFYYDQTTPFPSLYALLPVLGTCAIILFAQQGTLVSSLLSLKACVGIGLISYSAYLWHQPLFAFARIRSLTEPTWQLMLLLAACSLVLAYFSWRYIEVPARKRSVWPLPQRKTVFALSGTVASLLIAFGLAGHFTKGFPLRFDDALNMSSIEERLRPNHGLSTECEGFNWLHSSCQTNGEPEIVVWGDSFAMHLVGGLIASNPNARIIQMTTSVCGPFIGIAPTNAKYPVAWAEKCLSFNDNVIDFIKANKSIKYAVLSSPFGQFVNDQAEVLMRDGSVVKGKDVALEYLRATLDQLKGLGVKPVVFVPPPSPGFDAGNCLGRAMVFAESFQKCSFGLQEAIKRQQEVRSFLRSIDEEYDVVWLDEAVCDGDRCLAGENSSFIYRDAGHFSYEGSAIVGQKLDFYRLIAGN